MLKVETVATLEHVLPLEPQGLAADLRALPCKLHPKSWWTNICIGYSWTSPSQMIELHATSSLSPWCGPAETGSTLPVPEAMILSECHARQWLPSAGGSRVSYQHQIGSGQMDAETLQILTLCERSRYQRSGSKHWKHLPQQNSASSLPRQELLAWSKGVRPKNIFVAMRLLVALAGVSRVHASNVFLHPHPRRAAATRTKMCLSPCHAQRGPGRLDALAA